MCARILAPRVVTGDETSQEPVSVPKPLALDTTTSDSQVEIVQEVVTVRTLHLFRRGL